MITDLKSYQLAQIPQPKKGVPFTDPTFGTKLIRVTDATDGNMASCAYSYWSIANSNSTRLHIGIDSTSYLFDFNPSTFAIAKIGPMFSAGNIMQREGMTWSFDNPNVIYGLNGYQSNAKLLGWDVAKKAFVFEKDFTKDGDLPVGNPWQLSKSRSSDRYFCFSWKSGDGAAWKYVVCYDRQLNKTYKFDLQSAYGMASFDEARIDRNGEYVIFVSGKEVFVWKFATEKPEQRKVIRYDSTERAGGHGDLGAALYCHLDVWGSNGSRAVVRDLKTPQLWKEIYDSGISDWQTDNHVSLTGPDDTWCLFSSRTSPPDYGKPLTNEIFLVKTNGSKQIIRLAHHRSSNASYERSPFANLSQCGHFFAYNSDNLNPSGRQDVFIGCLPAGIWGASTVPSVPAPQPQPPVVTPTPPAPVIPTPQPPKPKPPAPVDYTKQRKRPRPERFRRTKQR